MIKVGAFGITLVAMTMAPSMSQAQVTPGSKPPLPLSRYLMENASPEALARWGADLPPVEAPTGPRTYPFTPGPPSLFSPEGAPVGAFANVVNNPGVNLNSPMQLTDGSIIAGVSCTRNWWRLTPDINGSYLNGTWAQIADLPVGHAPRFFGAGVFTDGRAILSGGEYNGAGCPAVWSTLTAIYDPRENTWTAVPAPAGWTTIGDSQATVLNDGTYFQSNCCNAGRRAALFNRFTHTWTEIVGAGKNTSYNEEGFTLLPNGNVLTVDAYVGNVAGCARNTEVFNPATNTWSSAGNTVHILADCAVANAQGGSPTFEMGPVVMMYNGSALAFGGNTANVAHTGLYNTATGVWTAGPNLPQTCGAANNLFCTLADAPAAMLPNGNVLFAASPGAFNAPVHFFEYLTATNTISAAIATDPNRTSYQINFIVLPTGQILRVSTDSAVTQVYTPDGSFAAALRPVVTTSPSCISPGGTYFLAGTQFNGRSEGANYGDESMGNTNFPLVRIVHTATGQVRYGKTFGHSTRSIAPGGATSTKFDAPAVIADGASTLFVVANGIPSVGTPVTVSSTNCSKGGTTSATHDFNGSSSNPQSDIAWRENASGATAVWFMNGSTVNDVGGFGPVPNTWSIVGQRDFNGDGAHDLLWRDTSGNVAMWFMFGKLAPTVANLGNVSTNWVIAGTGDFNGDDKGDIVWRDTATGAVAIWLQNGATSLARVTIGIVPPQWVIAGTGDFNGDGKADLLWRDTTTGAVAIWFMNGTAVLSTAGVGSADGTWKIAGTGDFNADGKSDILWRQDGTGVVSIWLLNSGTVGGAGNLGAAAANWVIANTGDFNGNGKTDILWRDPATGAVAIWFIDRLSVASIASVASAPPSWVIQGLNAD